MVNSGVHTNPLRIHTEFLPNSNAVGVLYGFFYIGESGIDFSRSLYFALSRNDSLRHELPSPLPAGVYYVHTYVIRENGLLSDGNVAPVTTEVFSGSGGTQGTYKTWGRSGPGCSNRLNPEGGWGIIQTTFGSVAQQCVIVGACAIENNTGSCNT